MKTKHILILLAIFFNVNLFAQGVYNSGAYIYVEDGTVLTIAGTGDFTNESVGHLILKGNGAGQEGELVVPGDFVNTSGDVTLTQGKITLSGDFTNNDATSNVFSSADSDGEVVFAGSGTQRITSSEADMSNYIDFEKVTVNSGSNTELVAGSAMTANGVFTVNSGATFTSKTPTSDAASGSLIINSSVGGTGTVNLERYFKVHNRWQYLSVPISNQSSDLLIDIYGGDINPNFYKYNEAFQGDDPASSDYGNWADFVGMWQNVGAGTTLDVGKGYVLNATTASDVNVTFSSVVTDLKSGDFDFKVTYTDNDNNGSGSGSTNNGKYYDGWNLVGNPFPSALDWDVLGRAPSMDNTVYFWDGDNGSGNYIYHFDDADDHLQGSGVTQTLNSGAETYIPAYQSFMVHLTPGSIDDNGSVTTEIFALENAAQVHNNHAMYKSESKETPDFEFLRLKVENDGKSDETIVRFIEGTEKDFNGKEDAFKMFPWDKSIPMIFSVTTETQEYPLAINSLPISSIGSSIPLGFRTDIEGTYTIQVPEFNFDAGTEVKLIDTQENIETILYEGAEYTFDFAGDESRTRFYIFKGVTGIEEEPISDDIESNAKIWSSESRVFITVSSYKLVDADVQIFDMLGRQVIDQKVTGAYNIINIENASGTYFVNLRTKDGKVKTAKVFIKK